MVNHPRRPKPARSGCGRGRLDMGLAVLLVLQSSLARSLEPFHLLTLQEKRYFLFNDDDVFDDDLAREASWEGRHQAPADQLLRSTGRS